MQIGVVFPQTEIGADPSRRQGLRPNRRRSRLCPSPSLRSCDRRQPRQPARLASALQSLRHVPRAVGSVRLPGRVDQENRVRHRHHHPAAAANRLGRQTSRRSRCLERRAACASASASAGTRWNTKRSAKISKIAAAAAKSKSKCCASSGPNPTRHLRRPLAQDH